MKNELRNEIKVLRQKEMKLSLRETIALKDGHCYWKRLIVNMK